MDSSVELVLKTMEELSSSINSRMEEFEKHIPAIAPSNPTVKTLNTEFFTFKTLVWKALSVLKAQVELLVLGLDRVETHSRRKVLLLHGVQEDPSEDIMQKTLEVLVDRMKLTGVNLDSFEACHRLGARKDTARPVLVRFSSLQLRARVWRAKTTLKGTKIKLSEFLTKARQNIFASARNHFGLRKCWSADGVIIVLLPDKTRAKITSSFELKQLIAKHPKSSTSEAEDN